MFLHTNGISTLFRAHQVCQEGYQELFDRQLVTVWSAPNYCRRFNNLASICEISSDHQVEYNVFRESPVDGDQKVYVTQVEHADQKYFL